MEIANSGRLLKVDEVFPNIIPATKQRGYDLVRQGLFPPGVVVHLGRQVYFDPARLSAFIEAGGAALPGGWRREARP